MHLANFPLDCDLNSGEIVKYDVFTKLDKEEKDRLKRDINYFELIKDASSNDLFIRPYKVVPENIINIEVGKIIIKQVENPVSLDRMTLLNCNVAISATISAFARVRMYKIRNSTGVYISATDISCKLFLHIFKAKVAIVIEF
jgi:hypothetical protein